MSLRKVISQYSFYLEIILILEYFIRNVIVDVADPGRKKFKSTCVYQLHSQQTDYSVLNFDKVISYYYCTTLYYLIFTFYFF